MKKLFTKDDLIGITWVVAAFGSIFAMGAMLILMLKYCS